MCIRDRSLGSDYEEPWHEPVHYLDKRVTELSVGLNKLADAQSNLSGSSATSIATNRAKTPLVIGTRATQAKAGNTTTISALQANQITSLVANQGKGVDNNTGGTIVFAMKGTALQITIGSNSYLIAAGEHPAG